MVGSTDAETPSPPLIDRIVNLIASDPGSSRSIMLERFARSYLKRFPDDRLANTDEDELLAEISDLVAYVDERDPAMPSVRVFTPALDDVGYGSPGSVVQVVADDGPFLVDSVSAAVSREGYDITRHLHPVIGTTRDSNGGLTEVTAARSSSTRESVQHFELDRELGDEEQRRLETIIRDVLADISATVADFEPMRSAVHTMIATAKSNVHHYDFEEIAETVEFLEWLLDDNFVFLGYREYAIEDSDEGSVLSVVAGSGLGILSTDGDEPRSVLLGDLPKHLRDRYAGDELMVVTKTNRHSTVHRDARMDYIGLRRVDSEGRMVTELRLLGLFTSKAYMTPASEIPVLRRKLGKVLEMQDVIEGSHDYKSIFQLFESFPKDDLFAMPVDSLSDMLGELVETEESESVRLFVRRDPFKRFVTVLVTVPRDRFNADLRKALQALFLETFGGQAIDYRLAIGESGDARIHFSVWVTDGAPLDVDIADLERTVVAMARNWDDRVVEELEAHTNEEIARALGSSWTGLFPDYYKTSTGLEVAAGDILNLERLSTSGRDVIVGLQNETSRIKAPSSPDSVTRITVYRSSGKLNLSEMMPLIEDLGVIVVEEVPTRLSNEQGTFIHDFGVLTKDGRQLDIERVGTRIGSAIEAVLAGEADTDSLNRLLVTTDLTHSELMILRAYRSYWRLVTPSFSGGYVDDALAAHPHVAEHLVRLFQVRFSMDADDDQERAIGEQIVEDLNRVAVLDEDRILRGFLGLIMATERTNLHLDGRGALALKFSSGQVPDMPDPKPLFEIFVYSPEVEGIHLRGGMVARGGIRWSDRREDYRTEVLGLMKAQMTKNVVIVPTGAKGGFVLKRPSDSARPTYEEVRAAYSTFVRGLLDVTDNRVAGAIVPPEGIRIHDGDDPYLVVAADKGTASFSDTANEIAQSYGFWLDDAFASGGSAGYDHKQLGITARGAWESVRRHFLDLGMDADTDEISVVGIGDMSGDVFGNGMLLSQNLKLVAAFDHRHIFIDPDPVPKTSWEERSRLAAIDRSTWEDYDPSLISKGGGVFARTAKSVVITPQMQEALGTSAESLTPAELIRTALRAPVDLLWNGGIGTYVKARSETNEQVQDRSNDPVRVNGRDLRCRVVGEGGNLGLTQLGRIEFDRIGGRVFADFVDNSGGVNASDREVNLKILLRMAEESGDIDRAERDQIIGSVASDVCDRILYDNFLQAQIISQEAAASPYMIDTYADLMDRLEREGLLNREIEFLPSSDDMAQRSREGHGMSRPEIAVLLSYAKMSLTEHLIVSDLPDDPHFVDDLLGYFPNPIVDRFGELILAHPLRRELIATIVANQVLNSQGSTFYSRLRTLTGSSAAMIVRAYRIARRVTNASDRWAAVEALGSTISPEMTREMLQDIDRLVTIVTRWYLIRPSERSIDEEIDVAASDFEALSKGLPEIDDPEWQAPYLRVARDLVDGGVPEELAARHAFQRVLRRGPDMVDLAHIYGRDALDVAALYTRASRIFYLGWLERQIRALPGATSFDRLAIESLRDDLQWLRRDVVSTILDEADGSIDAYLEAHDRIEPRLERWHRWINRDGIQDVSAGLIAVRRLRQILIA
jgi:glutamate dehydrogenase